MVVVGFHCNPGNDVENHNRKKIEKKEEHEQYREIYH